MIVFENEKCKVIEFIEPGDVSGYLINPEFPDPELYNDNVYEHYRQRGPIYLIDNKSEPEGENSFVMICAGANVYMNASNVRFELSDYFDKNFDIALILLQNCEKDADLIIEIEKLNIV